MDLIPEDLIEEALDSDDPELIALALRYLDDPFAHFSPRPDAPELYDEQASFVTDQFPGMAVALGGNSSGKTCAGAYKFARFLRTTPPPRPNCPAWIVSQSIEMASGTCWGRHLSQFIPDSMIRSIKWYSEKQRMPAAVILKKHRNGNNWMIEFKSSDQSRARLQGSSIGLLWLDELCPYSILTECWQRLREYDLPGSKFYTLTPLEPAPELESIFVEQERFPDWRFYRLNAECNKTLAEGFLARALDNELEERRETRRIGAFASYMGCIYQQFNPKVHVVDPFEIPPGWQRSRAVDFGYSHPTVCLYAAKDPHGRFYVYREYFQDAHTIEEHVQAINDGWDYTSPDYGTTWADPAAAQDRAEYAQRGLLTSPAQRDVKMGIAAVQRALRLRDDGKPGLFIFRTCTNLIRELRTYSWSPYQPDRPLKENDDCADSLRYLIFSDQKTIAPWKPLTMPARAARVPI